MGDQSPWSNAHQYLLIIVDANNSVEKQLLQDWLTLTQADAGYNGKYSTVYLPLSSSGEEAPSVPLAEIINGCPDETLVTPVRIAWGGNRELNHTRPRLRDLLFGFSRRPGLKRAKQIADKHPERINYITGAPATVAELRKRYAEKRVDELAAGQFAGFIARQASLALDIAERKFKGSRYKVPRYIQQTLLARPDFNQALSEVAEAQSKTIDSVREEAREYMQELISIPSPFWIDVMSWVFHGMINLGYEAKIDCDQEEIDKIRKIVRENPAAFLWTHKSHTDGPVISSILYDNDFPAPHMMGGINMAFAGIGFMAKRSGAIFIRRSFQDTPVYKLVLKHYIGYLIEKRFPLTWAFEGTRSRIGKLMPPRYGIMKYVMEAVQSSSADKLYIIPTSISYDMIGDVADYAKEQAGKEKRAESLAWFIGYLRGLRRPMGRVHVNFGQPVLVDNSSLTNESISVAKVAFDVGVQVNKVTPITIPSLICMVLLGAAPAAFTTDELRQNILMLVEWANTRGIPLTSDFSPDSEETLMRIVSSMIENDIITRYDEGPETLYGLAQEQHGMANYYRNTTIHFFVNKAIAELASAHAVNFSAEERIEAFWQEAEALRDLFKFEFFYSPGDVFRQEIDTEMTNTFDQWEQMLISEGAWQRLATFRPLVAHATVLSFVEAYLVVADVLARMEQDAVVDKKTVVSEALKYGRQAYLQRRIGSEASIGKLLFENGFSLMENRGLTKTESENTSDVSIIMQRKEFAHSLRELARRMDHIRSLAVTI